MFILNASFSKEETNITLAGSLLMILTGVTIMTFGLFLFYAWLPLLYAVIGLDIGLLLGRLVTGDIGALAVILGIACAQFSALPLIFSSLTRILLGVSAGILVGLSIAATLMWKQVWVPLCMFVLLCGILGGILVRRFFNAFVIGATSFSGATLAVAGAHHLLPEAGLFNLQAGDQLPAALVVALTLLAVFWQAKNFEKSVRNLSI